MSDKKSAEVTVSLTQEQVSTILTGLYDRYIESQRYRGEKNFREPKETDLCCDTHKAIYERDRDIHAAMVLRVEHEKALIAMFEAVEER